MKLKFLGAAGTVTGSGYLLTSRATQVMVDFGMFQGTSKEDALNYQKLDFNPSSVNALFLTHAHLDHVGRLPLLIKKGFTGPIFATAPTFDLAQIVLYDAAKIAESDHPQTALYSEKDVEKTLRLFEKVEYNNEFTFNNLKISYINAGHILGSASIKICDSENSIAFSGDLGSFPDPLVPSTAFFDSADYVILESTYGGKTHPKESPLESFLPHIKAAVNKKSTLLIPSFAIQKTQILLDLIQQLKNQNQIPQDLKIFLDSPMASKVTNIYRQYPTFLNSNFQNSSPYNFFTSLELYETIKYSQSRKINKVKGPKVIIAGSGMMNGGRILSHAKQYLSKENNLILFVGYQAVETIGRAIKEGAEQIEIDNHFIKINAHVESLETMSSHADEPRLLEWLSKINNFKQVILTHGEDEARIKLASSIRKQINIPEVKLPQLNNEYVLN